MIHRHTVFFCAICAVFVPIYSQQNYAHIINSQHYTFFCYFSLFILALQKPWKHSRCVLNAFTRLLVQYTDNYGDNFPYVIYSSFYTKSFHKKKYAYVYHHISHTLNILSTLPFYISYQIPTYLRCSYVLNVFSTRSMRFERVSDVFSTRIRRFARWHRAIFLPAGASPFDSCFAHRKTQTLLELSQKPSERRQSFGTMGT